MLAGGLFPNITTLGTFASSRPYFQDDMTWCILKSKNYPMIINAFLAVAPECWILLIFGIGYGIALLIYIMVQFDLKYNQRNNRDWHYTLLLITLPGIIGFNQRFKPKSTSLRIFYGFILIMMLFIWQIVYFKAIRFIKIPMQRPQISTVDAIASHSFHLSGSLEVKALISFDTRVDWVFRIYIFKFQKNCFHFSTNNRKLTNFRFVWVLIVVWMNWNTMNVMIWQLEALASIF